MNRTEHRGFQRQLDSFEKDGLDLEPEQSEPEPMQVDLLEGEPGVSETVVDWEPAGRLHDSEQTVRDGADQRGEYGSIWELRIC